MHPIDLMRSELGRSARFATTTCGPDAATVDFTRARAHQARSMSTGSVDLDIDGELSKFAACRHLHTKNSGFPCRIPGRRDLFPVLLGRRQAGQCAMSTKRL